LSQAGKHFTSSGGIPIERITGNAGGPVSPDVSNDITIIGSGTITVTGTPLTNTLTISSSAGGAVQFDADAGSATAALGILEVLGSHGLNTSGAANVLTIALDNTLILGDLVPVVGDALTLTSGNINVTSGNIELSNATAGGLSGVIEVNTDRFIHNYGTSSTFIGHSSGNFTHTGSGDTAIGADTLAGLTTGNNNTAGGYKAQAVLSSGANNTSLGKDSLVKLTTSNQNSALGSGALSELLTGANNIGIGYNAGNTYVGAESNNIAIGSVGVIADSGTIRIGTNATHTGVYIAGIDSVNVGNVATVVTEAGNKLGTAVLTAGTGITITPTANTITITGNPSVSWTVETVNLGFTVNTGIIANKAGLLTVTLPATAAIGDILEITNMNTALGWKIAQNANQFIRMGALLTTVGVGGSVSSTALGDSLKLVCNVAGASTGWIAVSSIGNLTIV
jgi:hypothetical protein